MCWHPKSTGEWIARAETSTYRIKKEVETERDSLGWSLVDRKRSDIHLCPQGAGGPNRDPQGTHEKGIENIRDRVESRYLLT